MGRDRTDVVTGYSGIGPRSSVLTGNPRYKIQPADCRKIIPDRPESPGVTMLWGVESGLAQPACDRKSGIQGGGRNLRHAVQSGHQKQIQRIELRDHGNGRLVAAGMEMEKATRHTGVIPSTKAAIRFFPATASSWPVNMSPG